MNLSLAIVLIVPILDPVRFTIDALGLPGAGKDICYPRLPRPRLGMLKLTPEQHNAFVDTEPTAFTPVKGAWGRGGATSLRLAAVSNRSLRLALAMAWRNVAPPRLTTVRSPSRQESSNAARKGRKPPRAK